MSMHVQFPWTAGDSGTSRYGQLCCFEVGHSGALPSFPRPPALDPSGHESRAEPAAVQVARLRLQLSRPRRHRHAAGDVAGPQPLSRAKAQPTQMDPVASRLRLDPRDVLQQVKTRITAGIEPSCPICAVMPPSLLRLVRASPLACDS